MNRTDTTKTAQFHVGIAAVLVLSVGLTGMLWPQPEPVSKSQPSGQSTLEVRTGGSISAPTIDALQGATPLQNQGSQNLQQPKNADALQPNAKTDSFGGSGLR